MDIREKQSKRAPGKCPFPAGFSAGRSPLSLVLSRRCGQILIPSLLVIPSLMLFVYLLFETTKLSREKIRQQFAVDSAAFIQMGDYTNLLNRTAYVNGAFPYRIFKEMYECDPAGPGARLVQAKDVMQNTCSYDLFYDAGAFPKDVNVGKNQPMTPLENVGVWDIQFSPNRNPSLNGVLDSRQDTPLLELITKKQAELTHINYLTHASAYYNFYSQVYYLLGSVEASQWTVFERLTSKFSFFRKSYSLNASPEECANAQGSCGDEGLEAGFNKHKLQKGSSFFMHYVQKISFWGRWDNPADLYDKQGEYLFSLGSSNPPMDMTQKNPDGLFQLATIKSSELRALGNGFDVYQGWNAPDNFFDIKFNDIGKCNQTGRPCVHALITSQCPGSGNNCVWPQPTPSYKTRLYP